MKTLVKFSLLAAAYFTASQSKAQTTGQKIDHDAKKVGHKTSEIAANGTAAVVDKKYSGKYGPGGQTVYINKNSHYYYINKLGHKVYLTRSEMRDRK